MILVLPERLAFAISTILLPDQISNFHLKPWAVYIFIGESFSMPGYMNSNCECLVCVEKAVSHGFTDRDL